MLNYACGNCSNSNSNMPQFSARLGLPTSRGMSDWSHATCTGVIRHAHLNHIMSRDDPLLSSTVYHGVESVFFHAHGMFSSNADFRII